MAGDELGAHVKAALTSGALRVAEDTGEELVLVALGFLELARGR
jgi:hypothetical protein